MGGERSGPSTKAAPSRTRLGCVGLAERPGAQRSGAAGSEAVPLMAAMRTSCVARCVCVGAETGCRIRREADGTLAGPNRCSRLGTSRLERSGSRTSVRGTGITRVSGCWAGCERSEQSARPEPLGGGALRGAGCERSEQSACARGYNQGGLKGWWSGIASAAQRGMERHADSTGGATRARRTAPEVRRRPAPTINADA